MKDFLKYVCMYVSMNRFMYACAYVHMYVCIDVMPVYRHLKMARKIDNVEMDRKHQDHY